MINVAVICVLRVLHLLTHPYTRKLIYSSRYQAWCVKYHSFLFPAYEHLMQPEQWPIVIEPLSQMYVPNIMDAE